MATLWAAVALAAAGAAWWGAWDMTPGAAAVHFSGKGIFILKFSKALAAVAAVFLFITAALASRVAARPMLGLLRLCGTRAATAGALFLIALALADTPYLFAWESLALAIIFLLWLAAALAPRRWRLHIARIGKRLAHRAARLSLPAAAALAGAVALAPLLAVKFFVYHDLPLTGDGASALFQGYVFAQARFKLPVPDFPDFYSGVGIIRHGGWYSMYPPGHSLLLGLGVAAHARWLVGPLSGAWTVALIWLAAARWWGRRCATVAAALVLVSPHWLGMSPSFMGHSSTALFLALATAALAFVDSRRPALAAWIGGFALGMAFASRPLSAMAAGAPLAAVFLWRSVRQRGWPAAWAAACAGGLIGTGFFLIHNWQTTGSPFVSGYEIVGPHHKLGFGGVFDHTPEKGLFQTLANLSVYSRWGPGCFPGVYAWLGLWFLCARRDWREWTMAACWTALPAAYFFYYYQDFSLGPRYHYEALVPGSLLAARGLQNAAERLAEAALCRRPRRAAARALVALGLAGALACLPVCGRIFAFDVWGKHQNNRIFFERLEHLASGPRKAVFINHMLHGLTPAENLRHPEGPLYLQHQGEARNREFMAAHPGWSFYYYGMTFDGPYEDTPIELREAGPMFPEDEIARLAREAGAE